MRIKRDKANISSHFFRTVLLTTISTASASIALANEVIDGGTSLNVPAGIQTDAAGYLIVGGNGFGQLSIAGEYINTDAYIGLNNLSQGQVFVSGANARWTNNGYLSIGVDGLAFVGVEDGATVIVRDGVDLAATGTGFAQLTLSGTEGARGVFSTPYILKGAGSGLLQWDGGILQASSSQLEFFPNFVFGDIDILGNGAFFDTNGYNVGIGTAGILIGSGGFTKLGAGTLTIAGNNSWDGDTTVTAGTLTLDDYTQSGSQSLTLGVANSTTYGRLNVTGVATFNNSNLAVDVIGSPTLANNLALTNVITAGTLNATGFVVTDNSALFDFTAVVNSNSVDFNVSASGGSSVYRSVLNNRLYPALGAAGVLDTQVQGTPTGDMADVVTALGTLPDERSVARATAQTLPLNAGSQATLGALNTINAIVAGRFAPGHADMPTDAVTTGQNVWIAPLGSRAVQDNTDNNASGYSADSWGLAGGIEGDIGGTRIGFAYAHTNAKLEGNSELSGAGTNAQINSNVIAAYGSHALNDMILGIQLDAGWSQNESKRGLSFGGLNRTASGSYDSLSLHAAGSLSQAFALDQATTFIPTLRADYTWLGSEGYSESGAGALSLDVEANTVDALRLGVEGQIVHALSPNAQIDAVVGVGYDVLNDDGDLVASYAGAPGQSFTASGIDQHPWLAKAGLGFTYSFEQGANVSLRYDASGRTDYLAQSVSLQVVGRF